MSAWVSTPPVMARLSSTMVIAVPFLWLRDGTHPLAAGPVNPGLLHRTGRSGRCCRWVPQNLGPGRQIDSQDNPSGVSRFAGQAGTQAPTLRPDHRKTAEAGPEALKPSSLPNTGDLKLGEPHSSAKRRSSVLALGSCGFMSPCEGEVGQR